VPESIRSALIRRYRWWVLLPPIGALVSLGIASLLPNGRLGTGLALFSIACTVAWFAGWAMRRCPCCRKALPPGFNLRTWPGTPRMNFCPLCGVSMDAPMPRQARLD
jgi:hypothetical protein